MVQLLFGDSVRVMPRRRYNASLNDDDFAPMPKVRKVQSRKPHTKASLPKISLHNRSVAMGSAQWFADMARNYSPGPSDIKEYYLSHVTKLRSQMEADPDRLHRLVKFARFGMESNNIFSGIRFDDESHFLLEEFLEPYLVSFREAWPDRPWHVHTSSCDIDPQCVKQLCKLSTELDNGKSCVFSGLEGRVPAVHLAQFVRILGSERPAKKDMTKDDIQVMTDKFRKFKEYLLKFRHSIFPRNAVSRCAVHNRDCTVRHRPRYHTGASPLRVRSCHVSPECVAHTGAGLNLKSADDSEFSRLLCLVERIVEAETGSEDFWTGECGPLFTKDSMSGAADSMELLFVRAGPQMHGCPFGRLRTLFAGVGHKNCTWVGPTEPAKLQADFEKFLSTSCSITHADCFFNATDDEVRNFYRPQIRSRFLHGLADTEFDINWASLRATMPPGAVMRFEDSLLKVEALDEVSCAECGAPDSWFWDNEHWTNSKLGKVSNFWPSMLTHGEVISSSKRRKAIPKEYLGPMGVNPFPVSGERKSFLVGLVEQLPAKEAINRIGNGLNVRVLLWWVVYIMSNCVRRDNEILDKIQPSSACNKADPSDTDSCDDDFADCEDDDFSLYRSAAGVTPQPTIQLPLAFTPDKAVVQGGVR